VPSAQLESRQRRRRRERTQQVILPPSRLLLLDIAERDEDRLNGVRPEKNTPLPPADRGEMHGRRLIPDGLVGDEAGSFGVPSASVTVNS